VTVTTATGTPTDAGAPPTLIEPAAAERAPEGSAGLRVKIFADGAGEAGIRELADDPLVSGFTTNPTLMRAAGVTDYETFARRAIECTGGLPISLEVTADELDGMERQARKIALWGEHVYVKVPITNSRGQTTAPVLKTLAADGVKVNVTALLTLRQVREVTETLAGGPPAFVSVFAGRIADSGRDPLPTMRESLAIMRTHPNLELIWASPRELLNVVQADAIGCHVITVSHDLLKKLPLLGKDLDEFSLDTVRMFLRDANKAGYVL
jgi:transaldolase